MPSGRNQPCVRLNVTDHSIHDASIDCEQDVSDQEFAVGLRDGLLLRHVGELHLLFRPPPLHGFGLGGRSRLRSACMAHARPMEVLTVPGPAQLSLGVPLVPLGSCSRESERPSSVLVGEPSEVAELDQSGLEGGFGLDLPKSFAVDLGLLRRAISTSMRRIASAAAAKKWPQLSQPWSASESTSWRKASWTSAVA